MVDEPLGPTRPAPVYRETSRASTAIVVGCLGLLCLPPLSALGFWLAMTEQRAIDEGARDPTNRKRATVALNIGIIGLSIWGIVLVAALLTAGLELAPD